MFWVVRSSGIYPVRKNGIGQLEQEKIQELQNQIKQNSSAETIETMKTMNACLSG